MQSKNKKVKDPFDIYLTFGVVISGPLHDLEVLLNDINANIKHNPNLKLIYTKTSGNRLSLVERDRGQDYYTNGMVNK